MNNKKIIRGVLAALLAALMVLSIVACVPSVTEEEEKVYTYNTYTSISPSNWNELTYQDNNDTQIMSYIGSSFFSFDFKFDENGEIVTGDFVVTYEAATKLEDVTAAYAEAWGLPAEGKGYAYKITLRNDLKWQNGDPIKAEDFVYTMEQQLDPEFKNYRADSFYVGSTIIANAQGYAKQGETIENLDNGVAGLYTLADLVKNADGVYTQPDGSAIYFALTEALDWCGGASVTDYSAYLDATAFAALQALAGEDGRVAITDESIALWTALINTEDWGYEPVENLPLYWVIPSYTYPEMTFDKVGIFAASDYELVIVLEKALDLLKEDGSLSYKAAYNMSSLPLVHKATYEACKQEPAEGSTLKTSNYNSSVETTMSWGPYKLESFQAGKQYTLVKNDNWYGYGLEENEGLYQTDRIVCDTIEEWNSAWVKFLAGEIDGIGIDVSVADDYKGSDRAYFTPSDFVGSLQLQSSKEQLAARQSAGVNKTLLADVRFRKALSLSINRADFATKTTTSSLQGFGLYNSMHYYDVANGKAYRESDAAKKVLCEIYNVDYTQYENLDAAVDAITGYDIDAARALVEEAYQAALAAGEISATDKVVITMGSGAIDAVVQRRFDYITSAWKELVKGTSLEGRLETEVQDFGNTWANDFRAGKYDVCMGGWTGAAWDPGYFLLAYLSPSYMYSAAWDTSSTMMTFTMMGEEYTMSLMDWYKCLNGSGAHDWSSNALAEEDRLPLIAALEKEVLKVYYTVPLYNNFSASLLSYKVDYVTYTYNTFMSYGGMKYMTYNFSDAEWAEQIASVNGEFDYK